MDMQLQWKAMGKKWKSRPQRSDRGGRRSGGRGCSVRGGRRRGGRLLLLFQRRRRAPPSPPPTTAAAAEAKRWKRWKGRERGRERERERESSEEAEASGSGVIGLSRHALSTCVS